MRSLIAEMPCSSTMKAIVTKVTVLQEVVERAWPC